MFYVLNNACLSLTKLLLFSENNEAAVCYGSREFVHEWPLHLPVFLSVSLSLSPIREHEDEWCLYHVRTGEVMLTECRTCHTSSTCPLLRRKRDYSQGKKTAHAQLSKYIHEPRSKSYLFYNHYTEDTSDQCCNKMCLMHFS